MSSLRRVPYPTRPFLVAAPLALLLLAGCDREPIDYQPNYGADPAVTLAVGRVDVQDGRQPLAQSNFIDERRGNEMVDETKRWIAVRIRSGGGPGTARAVIDQASITERLKTDRTGGVVGYVTDEPTYTLDGNLGVRIVITDDTGAERASASARVGRTRAVSNSASVVERDNEAKKLMVDLIHDIEPNLKQAIQQNLGQFVTSGGSTGGGYPPPTSAGTPYNGGTGTIQSSPLQAP